MAADIFLTGETDLVERARGGDRAALLELYRREAPTAWRLAVAITRDPTGAEAPVATAFAKVVGGSAPRPDDHLALRTRLLRATRAAATSTSSATPPAAGPLPVRAFHGLPERWRSTLWLLAGEDLAVAQVAPALGMSLEATEQLGDRARAGLREHFTLAHLDAAGTEACRRIAGQLDAYASEELSIRDARRARRHLDDCSACRDRLAELDDLIPALRRSAPPVPATLVDAVERAWAEAGIGAGGPLHLTLPSGRQMPAWAERAVAGAAAAVITLGITGAIVAGGRSKPRDDQLARQSASEQSQVGDGENALGLGELVLPSGAPLPSLGGSAGAGEGGSGSGAGSGSGSGATSGGAGGTTEVARSITPTSSSPSTTAPPPSSPPTTQTPAPAPAPEPAPAPTIPGPVAPEDEPTPPEPLAEPLAPVVEVVETTVEVVSGLLDPVIGGDTTSDSVGGLLGG